MTKEEKELLLKDLCSRLPYGVICEDGYGNDLELNGIDKPNTITFKCATKSFWITDDLDKCKPYLFPMSSMSAEQKEEYDQITIRDGVLTVWTTSTYDWLNKNHFDYRDLIKKGLAIDATNLNIY